MHANHTRGRPWGRRIPRDFSTAPGGTSLHPPYYFVDLLIFSTAQLPLNMTKSFNFIIKHRMQNENDVVLGIV